MAKENKGVTKGSEWPALPAIQRMLEATEAEWGPDPMERYICELMEKKFRESFDPSDERDAS